MMRRPRLKFRDPIEAAIEAVKIGTVEVLESYIAIHGFSDTLLHFVARSNPHVEVLKRLVSLGADVNANDHFGNTPLHSAVSNPCVEVLVYLIPLVADVNAKNNIGETPLDLANATNARDKRFILTDAGARRGDPSGWLGR